MLSTSFSIRKKKDVLNSFWVALSMSLQAGEPSWAEYSSVFSSFWAWGSIKTHYKGTNEKTQNKNPTIST